MTKRSRKKSAIILVSGGLDSAVALACARRDGFTCHALSFDYGQRHKVELKAAQRVCRAQGVASHRVIKLDLRAIGGSALTSDVEVPKDRDESQMTGNIPVTYVPARNTLFLSFALALAEVTGARDIFIGVNAVDYSGYPDCRPEFIAAFEKLARLATKAGDQGAHFKVRTPLIKLSKAGIVRLGAKLGVDFSLTHSCYDPVRGKACGRCDSCRLRLRGFVNAFLTDPIPYAKP
ncbi:MAG: 7-cyano-7-deazaguanine synthase QueC [Planctomycetes bacterium]|nr:7-cyano-7-deazaguanine synthase QueC [Planctomycetota bacterium]